jgi:hypothetical protein
MRPGITEHERELCAAGTATFSYWFPWAGSDLDPCQGNRARNERKKKLRSTTGAAAPWIATHCSYEFR